MPDQQQSPDLQRRVEELLASHDPQTTAPADFLGAQFDAGLAWVHFPQGRGGLGLARGRQLEVDALLDAAGAPRPDVGRNSIGLGMAAPTILAFGTQELQERYLRPLFACEEIWCQLFSEPGAGSDLAGVATRAVPDGDEWVVDGQKVWTSGAHYSDFGIVLVRTNPDVPKHKGLTMFWLDLRSAGVEIRPIHQMSGGSNFNEVYFTDVRIPDAQRLGKVDDGWRVALVTLMNERLAVGGGGGAGPKEILKLARDLDAGEGTLLQDKAFRQKLADWYVQAEGLRNTRMRTITALSRGQTPGPESSIGKIIAANQLQDIGNSAVEAEDQFGIINDAAVSPMRALFQSAVMNAPGLRIAGGTDEILKNIIAERVLGLPGEIRTDKEAAFRDLPAGR